MDDTDRDLAVGGPLVVMGVSGSGKTTVGVALARRLALPFADADDFHSPANLVKMGAGRPLEDDDRLPWLQNVADWLGDHADGGVVSCSALARRYRDILRDRAERAVFVHLAGSLEVISRRQAARGGHFMPAALMASQFRDLEPLGDDERGVTVDVSGDLDAVVDAAVAALRANYPVTAPTSSGDSESRS